MDVHCPWPLTPKAFASAKFKAHCFYENMIKDFEALNPADPVLPDLYRCIEHLRKDKVRVVVDPKVGTTVEDKTLIVSGGGL